MEKKIHPDRDFVKKILSGDQEAWGQFVDQFTDWVFYTVNLWTKPPDSNQQYEKKFIMKSKDTCEKYTYTEEAKNAYLWVMDQVKKKLKSYRGESKLSTYVWSILHNDWLRNDYLRWKYGDKRKIPKVLKNAPELEKQVFVLLRWRKNVEKIAAELGISIELVEKTREKVTEKLRSVEQEDMLETPREVELSDEMLNILPADPEPELEDRLLLKELKVKFLLCFQRLMPEKQSLIRLFYKLHLNAREILMEYQQANKTFVSAIPPNQLTQGEIRGNLKRIRNEILTCFKEVVKHIEGVVVNDATVVAFLKDQSICDSL